ncbi:hypothetical protein EOL70_15420 [Leucothrix sargassi]|nr:hypothetical protein EOL70_15420 [Leucothrix sargassi]
MLIRSQRLLKTVSRVSLLLCTFSFTIGTAYAEDPWGRPKESFVNWENPHVHPLHITPDGSKLLAVNTPDNSLLVFDVSGGTPVQTASIPVGLDPVSVRARTNNEVWVVNHVSDTVSVVSLSEEKVIATLKTDDEPADVVFAGTPQKAFVTASQANQVNVFDPSNLNAAPQSIFINGEDPRALAVSQDGSQVYAAVFESGNGTTIVTGGKSNNFEVDLVRRPEGPYGGINLPPNNGTEYNPPINPNIAAPPAVSMIVRKDDEGRWMDDNNGDWSRFISGDLAGLGGTRGGRVEGWDLPDRDVAIINANTLAVSYQSRLMNANMALSVHPTSGEVTVVGTDATNEVRWEPNVNSTFIRVNMARFVPGGTNNIVDLNPHLDYSTRTVAQSVRDQAIGDPRGIVWNAAGTRAYITGMGSNNVVVINNNNNRVGRIEVGEGPTGIVMSNSGGVAYVLNKFDASISTINLSNNSESSRVAFFDPTPESIKKGRPHLYDTHATSGLGQASCASCHIDGRTDRLAWDLGNPAGDSTTLRGFLQNGSGDDHTVEHPPVKGPLLTMTLQDIIGHPSMHWSGDQPDIGHFAEAFESLQGDDEPLDAESIAAFETFLDSIHIPSNPYRLLDNNYDTTVNIPGPHGTTARVGNAESGAEEFENRCRRCHDGHSGRGHFLRFNGGFAVGQAIRPPTWRNFHERFGLWFDDATASNSGFGFQQDGSFDSTHNESRSADMMAFMLSFNGRFPYTPAGLNEGNHSKDTHAAVGTQVMLKGAVSNADSALLTQLFTMANQESIGVVAKGVVDGEARGYAYLGNGNFQSDRESEVLSIAQLQAIAEAGTDLVYTAVPAGSEIRIGIDSDLDGEYNRDERDQASDAQNTTATAGPNRCISSTNVATLGTATQSSTFGDNRFPASLAIDGDEDNFTHTATGQSPATWSLALDKNYLIESIVLHNRSSAQSRLRDITVYILDESGEQANFKSHFLNRHNRDDGPDTITVDLVAITGAPVDGRNIRVVRTPDPLLLATNNVGNADESDVLSLAEVEVNGCVQEVIDTSQAPVGVTDVVSVDAGETITIDVLANDIGGGLTLTAPNAYSLNGGNVALVDNKLTYTPKAGFAGEDNIWYVFSDSLGRTNSGRVDITVTGEGTAAPLPVGVEDNVSVDAGNTITIDVLANDTGTGLVLIAPSVWSLEGGNVALVDNQLRYTPKAGFTGNDNIWYTFNDTLGRSTYGQVNITVTGTATPVAPYPVAITDTVTTPVNTAITIDVLANDTGAGLTIHDVNGFSVNGATISIVDNQLRYVPQADFTGSDSFWYAISDNQSRLNAIQVNVTVGN